MPPDTQKRIENAPGRVAPARIASAWRRFLEDSSFLRHYLWKYRVYVGLGLLSLVIVDVLEVLPPIFLKRAVDITVEHGSGQALFQVAVAYVAVALIQGVCRYV